MAQTFLNPGPAVEKLTSASGYSLSEIYQMYQSKRGFLYFAGAQGLLRYDGYQAIALKHNADDPYSLSSDIVFDVIEDEQGFLWISTVGGGLNRFDPATHRFEHYRSQANQFDTLSSDSVYEMTKSHDGRIWIASRKGLNLFDTTTGKNIRYNDQMQAIKSALDTSVASNTFTMLEDKDTNLWFSTYGKGLSRFDLKTGEFKRFIHDSDNPNSLADNVVRQVIQDSQGIIWVATTKGVSRFLPEQQGFANYTIPLKASNSSKLTDVWRLFEDADKRLWAGARFNGLSLLDRSKDRFIEVNQGVRIPNVIEGVSVYDIIQDASGMIWMSTESDGIIKLNPGTFAFEHFGGSGSQSLEIKALYHHSDGQTFIAAKNGLYRRSAAGFEQLLSDVGYIRVIRALDEKTLALGISEVGLFKYHTDSGQFEAFTTENSGQPLSLPANNVQSMAVDDNGGLWVGLFRVGAEVPSGLYYLAQGKNRFVEKMAERTIEDILPLSSQKILIATRHDGVALLDNASGEYQYLTSSNDSANNARMLFQDSRGQIWVGTFGGGLGKVDLENRRVVALTKKDGLPSNDIRSIAQDQQGRLWLGARGSLIWFDPSSEKVLGQFGASDGLRLESFGLRLAVSGNDNHIIMADNNQLLSFSVEAVAAEQSNSPTLPTMLTSFKLFNQPVTPGSELLAQDINHTEQLRLSYQDSLFSIAFASSNYRQQKHLKYAYQLKGFNHRWIETDEDNRVATFTSLEPKDYELKVRVSNPDGSWNSHFTSLKISVTPPFWRTWTAYIIYLLLVCTSLYSIYRYRTARLIKRAKELEQKVQERTATINTLLAQKERMFANVSHEFRTPLTLIISPIEGLLKMTNCNSEQAKSKLLMIKRNGQRLLRMVEQLLELSRLEANTEQGWQNYALKSNLDMLLTSFQPLLQAKDIKLICPEYQDVVLRLKPDSLEMILVNLLSNAIKYTKPGGEIEVKVDYLPGKVRIAITDTGIGISEENQQIVFNRFTRANEQHDENIPGAGIGLALVKELVEGNGGQLSLQSTLGVGSTFTATLPLPEIDEQQSAQPLGLSQSSQTEINALMEAHNNKLAVQFGQAEQAKSQASKSQQVLLIDDNSDMLALLSDTLGEQYDCLRATNGEMGIKLALEHIPDVIVCDVMMPGIDGFEVANTLKGNELTCHIPFLFLSAKTDIESRMQGWQQDADDYLTKPFHPDELRLRIASVLSIRRILQHRFAHALEGESLVFESTPDNRFCGMSDKDKALVEKFEQIIAKHYHDSQFNRIEAAKLMAMSDRQLHRKLDALFDQTFSEYLRKYRLKQSLALFKTGMQITQIADSIGFSSISYFAKCFNAEYGMPPKQYQKQLLGE